MQLVSNVNDAFQIISLAPRAFDRATGSTTTVAQVPAADSRTFALPKGKKWPAILLMRSILLNAATAPEKAASRFRLLTGREVKMKIARPVRKATCLMN